MRFTIYIKKVGYLYECDNLKKIEAPTQINCAYTSTEAIAIDRVSKANPSFPAPSRFREGAAGSVSLRHYPNRPESSGTRVRPMRATPPPAMSCFMPWLFANVR